MVKKRKKPTKKSLVNSNQVPELTREEQEQSKRVVMTVIITFVCFVLLFVILQVARS